MHDTGIDRELGGMSVSKMNAAMGMNVAMGMLPALNLLRLAH
jgi:hypothetical protein